MMVLQGALKKAQPIPSRKVQNSNIGLCFFKLNYPFGSTRHTWVGEEHNRSLLVSIIVKIGAFRG